MNIIAIINQKGGVGKTTTTVNLGHSLTLAGKRVTLIDLDPQGHLEACLGVNGQGTAGVDQVLMASAAASQCSIEMRAGLDVIPAGAELAELERADNGHAPDKQRLQHAIVESLGDRDFVLIDCPPSTGPLVEQGLFAAQAVLVPVVSDYLSLRGLSYLTGMLRSFATRGQGRVAQRIAVTRFHTRRRLSGEAIQVLLKHFPDKVLATPIRECAALAECPSFGQTIFEYRKHSHGAEDYRSLAADLLKGRTM
jgi:chromosome partitioning protein